MHGNIGTHSVRRGYGRLLWPLSSLCVLSSFICVRLCDPMDCSPPGSSVPRILQARILEWVAISFSNAWKWKMKVKSLSRVRLLATPWTVAYQAPSMEFSRQEYWSGLPLQFWPDFKWVCRKWQLTLVLLPGKFHGQRRLAGCSLTKSQTRLAEQQQQVGLKWGKSKMILESPTMVRTILHILKGYHSGKLFLQSPDILSALWARQSLL